VNNVLLNLFFDEVSIYFNVLCPVMMNWIFCYAYGYLIITMHLDRCQ